MTKYQYPLQNLDCVKIQNSGVVFFLYTMRTDSHESRACTKGVLCLLIQSVDIGQDK